MKEPRINVDDLSDFDPARYLDSDAATLAFLMDCLESNDAGLLASAWAAIDGRAGGSADYLAAAQAQGLEQWAQDEAIALATARECLSDLLGIFTNLLCLEKSKEKPDTQLVAQLSADRSRVAQERLRLHLQDRAEIRRISQDYGDRVRVFRASTGGNVDLLLMPR
jgi:hypothetical protein